MAIVNPTIVELSEKVDCRYTLVVEASTATTITTNRKLVPHRGWCRGIWRALSTVSSSPRS